MTVFADSAVFGFTLAGMRASFRRGIQNVYARHRATSFLCPDLRPIAVVIRLFLPWPDRLQKVQAGVEIRFGMGFKGDDRRGVADLFQAAEEISEIDRSVP